MAMFNLLQALQGDQLSALTSQHSKATFISASPVPAPVTGQDTAGFFLRARRVFNKLPLRSASYTSGVVLVVRLEGGILLFVSRSRRVKRRQSKQCRKSELASVLRQRDVSWLVTQCLLSSHGANEVASGLLGPSMDMSVTNTDVATVLSVTDKH